MKLINKIILALSLIVVTSLCMADDPGVAISADPSVINLAPGDGKIQLITVTVTSRMDGMQPKFQGTEQPTVAGLAKTNDNCSGVTLNNGGTCTLTYTYTPSSSSVGGVQTIGVNDISTVGMLTPTTAKITINKAPSGVFFINAPNPDFTLMTGNEALLNYGVINNTTDPAVINALSALPQGMNLVDLPSGSNPCFIKGVGIVLAAGSVCNIELSYDGSSQDIPNFTYFLGVNGAASVISPAINIHTRTADVPPVWTRYQVTGFSLDAAFLMSNNKFAAFGSGAIWFAQGGVDNVALPQLGHVLFANDGVSNKAFSFIGNSLSSSTVSFITPQICAQQAECSEIAMPISHAPTTINYDGQYYSDGQSLYKSSNDQPLVTANLLLSPAYQIDGLRVIYDAAGNAQTYYVVEHNSTGGVLMIGTADANNAIHFQQAPGLNLPALTTDPATTAIPGIKLYVDSSTQHIIIEQSGAQYVYISSNNGLTWQTINVADTLNSKGTQATTDLSVTQLPDGRILVFIGGEYSLAYSLDFGSSWVNLSRTTYPSIKGITSATINNGAISMMLSFRTANVDYSIAAVYTATIF